MKGEEVRKILQDHRVSLVWLAKQLGITPQGLNSRLNARLFKRAYLQEIVDVLQKDIFGINTKAAFQPVIDLKVNNDVAKILDTENITPTEYVSIPAFAGCVGIVYHGDDAAPKYENGDVVFVLPENSEIISGRKYFIFTKRERFVRIARKEKDDSVRLIAINATTDDKGQKIHDDIVIKNTDIVHSCKIVGAISREIV